MPNEKKGAQSKRERKSPRIYIFFEVLFCDINDCSNLSLIPIFGMFRVLQISLSNFLVTIFFVGHKGHSCHRERRDKAIVVKEEKTCYSCLVSACKTADDACPLSCCFVHFEKLWIEYEFLPSNAPLT